MPHEEKIIIAKNIETNGRRMCNNMWTCRRT